MQHYNNEVIYQIYPLTFNYASGSTTDPYPSGAYGNLKGITARVDYIKSLGVDTIWITPFYSSGGRGYVHHRDCQGVLGKPTLRVENPVPQ